MLDDNYHEQLKQLLLVTECPVQLPAQWSDFFDQKDNLQPYHSDKRRFVRRNFRSRCILDLEQSLPGVPREQKSYGVYSKDISRNGIAFLHSEQLFPGEKICVWLPTSKVRVTVARCRRHAEFCYEIGAKFAGKTE